MTQSLTSSPPPSAVALRARHDGWTPDRQRRFLEALAALGSITGAAAVVGMSVRSAYKLRGHPAAASFRAAWDAAPVRPVAAPGPTLVEQAEARETVSRSRVGRDAGFGGRGNFTINRPIPAWSLVRLLHRAEAKAAKAKNRAISLLS